MSGVGSRTSCNRLRTERLDDRLEQETNQGAGDARIPGDPGEAVTASAVVEQAHISVAGRVESIANHSKTTVFRAELI